MQQTKISCHLLEEIENGMQRTTREGENFFVTADRAGKSVRAPMHAIGSFLGWERAKVYERKGTCTMPWKSVVEKSSFHSKSTPVGNLSEIARFEQQTRIATKKGVQ